MNSGVYYLIARNVQTNEKIKIELTNKQEDRYCSTLSYIDSLTTKFKSKDQLVKRLYDNKYINFTDADIYIEYSRNELKFEEVIYQNLEGYTTLSPNSESKIDINNPNFNIGVNNYFEKLNNRHFRSYVLNSSKVNIRFKEHLEKYFHELYFNTSEYNKKKLIEDFSNYKLFRDFSFLIYTYENPTYEQEIENKIQLRKDAKLVEYRLENQMEFEIKNNELQISPSKNNSELEQVIQEHNDEKEEFLTDDDYYRNYYPYSIKNKIYK